ncbi:MAG: restriction endonuclease [Acidimicrobiaceae bacterium]|nr:restriction endonuclease [Acidimicrobiaceae bacterium]
MDFDLERLGRDQIQAHIAEHFAGHELGHLVAEVLKAEGFFTEESPAGPDGGIDVFAGRGPLGLDSPRLIVQVKSSPTPLNVKIVRELNGVLSAQNADQGLLVAWGGLNRSARRELRDQFFRVRVWDADGLIDAVFRNHDKLSEEIRADLPLKRIWSLAKD